MVINFFRKPAIHPSNSCRSRKRTIIAHVKSITASKPNNLFAYTPACVVETSPGNFQAWLKHAWTLTAQEGTVVAKILAERFGGDPNSADWRHFGRLAGFTNPKPQYRLPNGLFPYSQLKFAFSKGVIYEKTHEVLSEVEDRLLDQYVESQRSIQTRIGFQQHPRQGFELLDYAHFANKYAAHLLRRSGSGSSVC